MTRLKQILSMLLVLSLLTACMGALAEDAKTLILPGALKVIGEEAFTWVDATAVVLPEGIERIESKAFAGTGITEVTLPDTLTYIADDAFKGAPLGTVNVKEGTYAYEWAVRNLYINAGGALNMSLACNISTESVAVGSEIVWTAITSGGATGNYDYIFWVYKDDELWYVGKPTEKGQNTFTYVPEYSGTYHVKCRVTDGDEWFSCDSDSVVVKGGVLTASLTRDIAEPELDDVVTFTLQADGGSGKYSYTHVLYYNNTQKRKVADIDDNTFTVELDKAGSYYVVSTVYDGASEVSATSETITVKSTSTPGTDDPDELTIDGVEVEYNSLMTAQTQTWYVDASGGTAPYSYSFSLKNGSSSVGSRSYSSDNNFRYTFFQKGSYVLTVNVRDKNKKVVSEEYPFTVDPGETKLTGVVRIYIDTNSSGEILKSNSNTGHYELQINNDSGDGIVFDNQFYDNPVFSFGSTGGGQIRVFEGEYDDYPNAGKDAMLYTWSFETTAAQVDNLLNTVIPTKYLNLSSGTETDIGMAYTSKTTYNIKNNNCFTTVAAWCTELGNTAVSSRLNSDYTKYIAWRMYNALADEYWEYVKDVNN